MLFESGRTRPAGVVLLTLVAGIGSSACSGSGEGSQSTVAELTVYRSPT